MPAKYRKKISCGRRVKVAAINPDRHSVIDNESVLGYQRAHVGSALPWDHARHAVPEVWAKLSNDIGPRDAGRGIRSGT